MILTRKHLRRVVLRGDGTEGGICHHEGRNYIIVDRHDLQTTQHYLATDEDVERVESHGYLADDA